jgi:hypothetical protein
MCMEKVTDVWINLHTWIVWYCRNEDDGRVEPLLPLQIGDTERPTWGAKYNRTGKSVHERPYIENSRQTAPTVSKSPILHDPSIYTGSLLGKAIQLQFWTVSVQFRCSYLKDAGCEGEYIFGLYDPNGKQAGNVTFYDMWGGGHDPEALHEFILLSGLPDETIRDEEGLTIIENRGYNIMLIEWHESPYGLFIAERIALGVLNQDAVVRSFGLGPLWKEIILG